MTLTVEKQRAIDSAGEVPPRAPDAETGGATVLIRSDDFVPGAWAMVFLDDADQPGALAYHDLTPDGWPLSKVFVKTTLENNDLVSVSASHETDYVAASKGLMVALTLAAAGITYYARSIDQVFSFLLAFSGGIGLVYMGRWLWWRVGRD